MSSPSSSLESAVFSAGIAGASGDQISAEEQRRKQAEWASVVLQTVRSEFQARHFDLPSSQQSSSTLLAASDVLLTATSESIDAAGEGSAKATVKDLSASPSSQRASGPERMVLEVDGGRLGTVQVTVGREHGAIKVVIGIDDARQRALVGLEQEQLIAALRAAGLKVASVSVQARETTGTALAQSRRVMNHQPQNPAAAYRGPKRPEDAEADSGLNLVG